MFLCCCRGDISAIYNRAPHSFESSNEFPWPDNEVKLLYKPGEHSLPTAERDEEWSRQTLSPLQLPLDCYVCFTTLPDSRYALLVSLHPNKQGDLNLYIWFYFQPFWVVKFWAKAKLYCWRKLFGLIFVWLVPFLIVQKCFLSILDLKLASFSSTFLIISLNSPHVNLIKWLQRKAESAHQQLTFHQTCLMVDFQLLAQLFTE